MLHGAKGKQRWPLKLQELVLNPDTSQGMKSSVGRERPERRNAVSVGSLLGGQQGAECQLCTVKIGTNMGCWRQLRANALGTLARIIGW